MPPQGQDEFNSEWVYVSFYSLKGVTLNLAVVFKDDGSYNRITSKQQAAQEETNPVSITFNKEQV